MSKLLIINNLRNSTFEISPQKSLKILTINLLINTIANLLQNRIQKAILIFLCIIFLIIEIDNLIIDIIILIVKVYKFIRRAYKKWIILTVYCEIDIALDVIEFDVHEEFWWGWDEVDCLFGGLAVVFV